MMIIAAAADYPRPIPGSYWVMPGQLLAGQYPGSPDEREAEERLRAFLAAKVTVFVNLTEEDERVGWGYLVHYDRLLGRLHAGPGVVAHHRFPIPDGGTTSVDQMRNILDTIDAAMDTGETVYVHCLGGHGRTGTTIGCWLLRHGHVSREGVLDMVQELHDVMPTSWPSPEMECQRRFVIDWPEGAG